MPMIETVTSRHLYPQGSPLRRFGALLYFATLLSAWNLAGHTFLGFEQSHLQTVAGALAAVAATLLFEWLRAWSRHERPRFLQGGENLAGTLLPALIPGLAVGMLLYPNERLMPVVFAAVVSIGSKAVFRAPLGQGTQHVFNPSNFGIGLTLLIFPAVGLVPPYHFTENVVGWGHWLLPGAVLASGLLVHGLFTGRLPLCLAWLAGFVAQALVRSQFFDIPWMVPLMPMTSAAFILFTLYMVPDPATTPLDARRQVAFGLAVAAAYGVLLTLHVVFGLFFALILVCGLRGAGLWWQYWRSQARAKASRGDEPKLAAVDNPRLAA